MMICVLLMCVMYTTSVRVYSAGAGVGAGAGASRYMFYREMYDAGGAGEGEGERRAGEEGGWRRLFGGERAAVDAWPAACVLLDRYWAPRCSGSVLADRWLLTAAHCVTPRLAYVKYNTNQPSLGNDGDHTPVYYLYRHPEYKVVQEDLGRGKDVTLLHHDVGLVRTLNDMKLRADPPLPALRSMASYTLKEVNGEVVQVLGFGRTEKLAQGERLVSARLRVVSCDRGTWVPCMCGVAGGAGCAPAPAGVCSGDSGGPVVYRGTQVAVTSMGPVECAAAPGEADPGADPRALPAPAPTSVFTALYGYVPLINATMSDTDNALRMMRIGTADSAAPRAPPAPAAACTLLVLLATATATTISY